jgi:putative ABC transport system permease protein
MRTRDLAGSALEALFANKLRSALTMLGVVIGVGSVVLLVSLGEGARKFITSQFEGLGTNLIIIQPGKTDTGGGFGPPPGGSKRKLTIGDVEAIKQQANKIAGVVGIMFGTGTIKRGNANANSSVLGADDDFINIFNFNISQGRYLNREDSLAGRRLAVLGSKVKELLFGTENAIGELIKINNSDYRVIGVVAPMGTSLGLNWDELAYIPVRAAQKLFNSDALMGIRAKASTQAGMDAAQEEIKTILMARHGGEEDFTMMSQLDMLATMNNILNIMTLFLGAIASISMVVGGIGIMNIMLVSVTERTREIGIRRALGARRRHILLQFMAESLVLSTLGGVIGLLGAVALTLLVMAAKPDFDARIPLWIVFPAFGFSTAVGLFFGVWPAAKASRINTIDALRYE